jgi:hypothetical protein
MRDVRMTTSFVAPLARRDKTTIYQWFNTPECQSWLPPKTGIGESRTFSPEQAVLLMIHSDLNRWGIPVPFAGKLVARIDETLATQPNASVVQISFHENGASFCRVPSDDFGDGPFVADQNQAGKFRFALEVDVRGYRWTVKEAIEAHPQVIGAEDVAA